MSCPTCRATNIYTNNKYLYNKFKLPSYISVIEKYVTVKVSKLTIVFFLYLLSNYTTKNNEINKANCGSLQLFSIFGII